MLEETNFKHKVERDEHAQGLWEAEYLRLTADRPGILGGILNRGRVHVMRLALIYAILDISPIIKLPHLQAALELWRYASESVQFIFKHKVDDPDAEKILQYLREKETEGYKATRTKISKTCLAGHKDKQQLGAVRDLLVKSGLIEILKLPVSDGRKKAEWWKLVGVSANRKEEARIVRHHSQDSANTPQDIFPVNDCNNRELIPTSLNSSHNSHLYTKPKALSNDPSSLLPTKDDFLFALNENSDSQDGDSERIIWELD